MYPARSDFSSFEPLSAWWTYAGPDGQQVCAATGASVVAAARNILGLSGDARWDADLQDNLVENARRIAAAYPQPAWPAVLNALDADKANSTVGPVSLMVAIWLAYYQPCGLRLDGLRLPDNPVLPSWGMILTGANDGPLCYRPARDSEPGILSDAQRAAARDATHCGIRQDPGAPPPTPTQQPTPPASGVSVPVALAAAAAIALVAYFALGQAKPAGRRGR